MKNAQRAWCFCFLSPSLLTPSLSFLCCYHPTCCRDSYAILCWLQTAKIHLCRASQWALTYGVAWWSVRVSLWLDFKEVRVTLCLLVNEGSVIDIWSWPQGALWAKDTALSEMVTRLQHDASCFKASGLKRKWKKGMNMSFINYINHIDIMLPLFIRI